MKAVNERRTTPGPIVSSLAAFIGAGLRPRSALARAIVAVLVIKLVAVTGMMAFQSYADQSATANAAGVAHRIGPSSLP
jgi:chromate transport protein ChrA